MRGMFRRADVERFAKDAQDALDAVKWAGMRNVAYLTPEERARSSVEYQKLVVQALDMQKEYDAAVQFWKEDGFPE